MHLWTILYRIFWHINHVTLFRTDVIFHTENRMICNMWEKRTDCPIAALCSVCVVRFIRTSKMWLAWARHSHWHTFSHTHTHTHHRTIVLLQNVIVWNDAWFLTSWWAVKPAWRTINNIMQNLFLMHVQQQMHEVPYDQTYELSLWLSGFPKLGLVSWWTISNYMKKLYI